MSEGKKEILLGDCLELMKDIPNGSIDMILCDLPYGTTACKWDTIIPFEPLWEQYERIIKPNGAIVLTASQPFTSVLVTSNLKMFRYEWIWEKNRGSNFATVKYQPMKEHESILVFSKDRHNYYPIKEERQGLGKDRVKYKFQEERKNVSDNYGIKVKHKEFLTEDRVPRSIQKFNTETGMHPTQKPVALFEYLIKTYTNENDLVLDNTAGSGTTAIACLNTNRQFIVMEQEPNYFEKIKKRVEDFNKKFETKTLFGNEM
jgi:site-specific DNA-methyltransferase (adenine-specific)